MRILTDLDLALFQPVDKAKLADAFANVGLVSSEWFAGTMLKVWDPAYEAIRPGQRTWPFIDLFLYALDGGAFVTGEVRPTRLPEDFVLPGTPLVFEGASVWLQAAPRAVLDLELPRWHRVEISPRYNHRYERGVRRVARRRIETDTQGRKIRELPALPWLAQRLTNLRRRFAVRGRGGADS